MGEVMTNDIYQRMKWHRIGLLTVLCLFALAVAATGARHSKRQRPKTTERILLVHADELRYNQFGPNPGAHILKGRVHFSHQGTHLWCDSA